MDPLVQALVSEGRKRAWAGADKRHDMSLPPEVRNARENEVLDHYSVGADLGPVGGPVLGLLQEAIGRPVLSSYPELGNKLMPGTFNFKTPSNDRPGAIDPYTKPALGESLENLGATVSGSLDEYPRLQELYHSAVSNALVQKLASALAKRGSQPR